MSKRLSVAVAVGAAVAILVAAGCSTFVGGSRPNRPPTAWHGDQAVIRNAARQTVVVVGTFADPEVASVKYQNIGRVMSETLSRVLLNEDRFAVWVNPDLTREVREVTDSGRRSRHLRSYADLSEAHPEVDYVINGKVTDFHHTSDLAEELASKGLFGKRREAIVAIDFQIVDLRAGRLIAADHVQGRSPDGGRPSAELYRNVAFGSYMFWSTPLGRAGEKAIDRAVARIKALVPWSRGQPRITGVISRRKAQIEGGRTVGLARGQVLYVCQRRGEEGPLEVVPDMHTGAPLKLRVLSAGKRRSTGWLLGEAPAEVNLRGLLLLDDLPAEQAAPHPSAEEEAGSLAAADS